MATELVQEITKKGYEIPERYLNKHAIAEAIEDPGLWGNKLLIDFSLLSASSTLELAKFRTALSEWGCFQIINHGIESSLLQELIENTKQFFALPLEEKIRYSMSDDIFQGYGNDSPNWNERLFFTLQPEENRKIQFWPKKPENLGQMLDEYSRKLVAMQESLYKAMARSLNIAEDCFLNSQGKKGLMIGKLSFYPCCSNPKHVLGFQPHSDGTTMSIILPEKSVEGLEVQKDNVWYNVPTIPGALFVNLGDLGEVMSNGMFKSAMHRVVTSSLKDRISVAAFCHPEEKNNIGPVSELVNAHQPQLYKKFNIKEYRQNFFKSHGLGIRPLDAFKI